GRLINDPKIRVLSSWIAEVITIQRHGVLVGIVECIRKIGVSDWVPHNGDLVRAIRNDQIVRGTTSRQDEGCGRTKDDGPVDKLSVLPQIIPRGINDRPTPISSHVSGAIVPFDPLRTSSRIIVYPRAAWRGIPRNRCLHSTNRSFNIPPEWIACRTSWKSQCSPALRGKRGKIRDKFLNLIGISLTHKMSRAPVPISRTLQPKGLTESYAGGDSVSMIDTVVLSSSNGLWLSMIR